MCGAELMTIQNGLSRRSRTGNRSSDLFRLAFNCRYRSLDPATTSQRSRRSRRVGTCCDGGEVWASKIVRTSIVSPADCTPGYGGGNTAIGTCGTRVFIPLPTGRSKKTATMDVSVSHLNAITSIAGLVDAWTGEFESLRGFWGDGGHSGPVPRPVAGM